MEDENNNQSEGILEITPDGNGFLRTGGINFTVKPRDVTINSYVISSYRLREGLTILAETKRKKGRNRTVAKVISINGKSPDDYIELDTFDDFTVIDPNEQLELETGSEPLGMRIIDLFTPIGKGQRGLIVAPPRTGKTILLQQMAHGITINHPEVKLMMLLIDERPEEVTDMRRKVSGDVIASSNDKTVKNHVRLARIAVERAKRMVEFGQDVVILLDSITMLGRAYNNWTRSSGRTMSGGLDIKALQLPKQIFGSARNVENGGSLTIIATALIETGSRMDDIIFREFKGTGNMELVLDQKMANRRIYPAIDLGQSGTRKEELLIEKNNLEIIQRLRRHLDSLPFGQDVDMLLKAVKQHKSNKAFLNALQ